MSKKRSRNVAINLGGLPIVVEHYESPPPSPKRKGSAKGVNKQRKVPRTSYFRIDGSLDDVLVTRAGPSPLQAYIPDSIPEPFEPDNSGGQESAETAPLDESQPEEKVRVALLWIFGSQADFWQKNPNYYLKRWLTESSRDYLGAMYDRDAPPVDTQCDSCSTPTEDIYRCISCLGCSQFCSSCLITAHRLLPTHRTEKWNQSVWVDKSLASLGFVFNLGHRGRPCEKSSSYSELLLGDLNGFTMVNVRYCTHSSPVPIAKPLQLIAAGIFPCSDLKTRSAFTLLALDQYNISTTLGKTSGHKYYSILARVTKPGFPADVPDRYRELMSVHRRFAHILNLRRSGTLYAQHSTDVHPGDQALACIACPRPGFNFNWDEVSPSER
jgi:ferredoxin